MDKLSLTLQAYANHPCLQSPFYREPHIVSPPDEVSGLKPHPQSGVRVTLRFALTEMVDEVLEPFTIAALPRARRIRGLAVIIPVDRREGAAIRPAVPLNGVLELLR